MKRLTQYEREQIACWNSQGVSTREIARRLNRNHTVVSRELKRNTPQLHEYDAVKAQYYTARRAKKTNCRKLEQHEQLANWVRAQLAEKWSPEQIAGRLKHHPPPQLVGLTVSHEAIYQWIYRRAKDGGEPWLYHHLRRKHWERRKRYGRKRRVKVQIKDLVPVKGRPTTEGFGHLEIDAVVGKRHKSALSVHYDRVTSWVKIHPLTSLKAEETLATLESTLADLPPNTVQTLTFDRGSETALHYRLRQPYQLMTFHCDPYSPHQKGGVEQVNGLIRQFFPKGTDFNQISPDTVMQVEDLLNNRPRKKLNYLTPKEAVSGALNS